MQLTEQHIVKTNEWKEWCIKAKELYNQSLYYWKQSMIGNIEKFSEYELTGVYAKFNEPTFRALPSNTSQQIVRILFRNISSWKAAKKSYYKDSSNFLFFPKMPKYKKKLSELRFTSSQLKIKEGYVHFPKMLNILPIKTNLTKIDYGRVIPKSNHFVVEFIYTKEEKLLIENDNWLSIDVGLNNLVTCVSNIGKAFIINGKPLKSINEYYNKRKALLQSKLLKGIYSSKRIKKLSYKRYNKIKDYIHKTSREIINFCNVNNISKIIIGKNIHWKQNINIGKDSNRKFTQIPHATLIEKIRYKAQLEGKFFIETQEAYTSKCSALDLEPIMKHEKYLGKRVKRGLFRTSKNQYINADCNGALNICRLVLGDEALKDFDSILSAVVAPVRIKCFI